MAKIKNSIMDATITTKVTYINYNSYHLFNTITILKLIFLTITIVIAIKFNFTIHSL
jgi:hypothetical protein